MIPNALSQYKAVQIRTATPGELLIALYDGLFKFLLLAKHGFQNGKRAQVGESISRAYAIISELYASLDHAKYPELVDNLMSLYDFCMQRLTYANLKNDPQAIEDVIRVLTPVREAFTMAVREVQGQQPGAPPPQQAVAQRR